MRAAKCQVQKTQGVEERMRGVPERLQDDLLRYLSGACAVGVAPHAVDYHKQCGMLGHYGRDPVLVLFTPAQEADFGVFNPQEDVRTSVRLDLLVISPRSKRA